MLSSRQRRISASGAVRDDRAPGRAVNPHEAALNARPQVAQLQAQAALLDRRPPPMQPVADGGPVIQMVTFGKADERSQALFTTRTGLTGVSLSGGPRQPAGGQHQAAAAHQAAPAHQAPPANPPAIAHPPAMAANQPNGAAIAAPFVNPAQPAQIVANPGNAAHQPPVPNQAPVAAAPGNQAALPLPPANAANQAAPQPQHPILAGAAAVHGGLAQHGAAAAAGGNAAGPAYPDDFEPFHELVRISYSPAILRAANAIFQTENFNDAYPENFPGTNIASWQRIDEIAQLLKTNRRNEAYAAIMASYVSGNAYNIVALSSSRTNCHAYASTGNPDSEPEDFDSAFPNGKARLILTQNPPATPHIGVWGSSLEAVAHSGVWQGGTTYRMKLPQLPVFTCTRAAYKKAFLGYLPGNGGAAGGAAASTTAASSTTKGASAGKSASAGSAAGDRKNPQG